MLPRSAKLSRQPAGSGPHSRKSLKRATPASKGAVSRPARRGGAGAKPLPSGSDGGRTSGEGPDEWGSGGVGRRWVWQRTLRVGVRGCECACGGYGVRGADREARGSPRTPAACPRRACRKARSKGPLAAAPTVLHLRAAGDAQAGGALEPLGHNGIGAPSLTWTPHGWRSSRRDVSVVPIVTSRSKRASSSVALCRRRIAQIAS